MSVFDRIRAALFPNTLPDTTERDILTAQTGTDADEQIQRANALMEKWDPKRAEEVRRFNRTGNFIEGYLSPEQQKGSHREQT